MGNCDSNPTRRRAKPVDSSIVGHNRKKPNLEFISRLRELRHGRISPSPKIRPVFAFRKQAADHANLDPFSELRKDQGLRELVQERMQSVKVVLDAMVEEAPARQIVLRE